LDQELKVLKTIENKDTITQRDIANHTGMSLGAVNILIKRLVKKGLVKIERISPKLIKYILTPHGMKEKAKLTLNYIANSYNYIKNIETGIMDIINTEEVKNADHIYIFGDTDEVQELITNKLTHLNINYTRYDTIESLMNTINNNGNESHITITWDTENIDNLQKNNIPHINIFKHF
jgi:DNA-binding MarR family transcriptional regulator